MKLKTTLPPLLAAASQWPITHFANPKSLPKTALFPSEMPLQLDTYEQARARLTAWPEYEQSPLLASPELAKGLGIGEIFLKDETYRFGVGSFKALGGAYFVDSIVAADESARCFSTASAGNHGVGLAWGCKRLGAECHVFLHGGVPERQAEKMRNFGATVHRVSGNYEASVEECKRRSAEEQWQVVQDVSWEGYTQIPKDIFSGYTVLAGEVVEQLQEMRAQSPTHVFVNAGVGGLASAVCAHLWARYGADRPRLVCVEPAAADCLMYSARQGRMAEIPPPEYETVQVGLDCKVPTQLAWDVLETGATDFVSVGDEVVAPCIELLTALESPLVAGESAVAGLAAVVGAAAQPEIAAALGLNSDSRVAVVICEGKVK